MVASPYAKSIRPMPMGQPSLSSGIMGTPSFMNSQPTEDKFKGFTVNLFINKRL